MKWVPTTLTELGSIANDRLYVTCWTSLHCITNIDCTLQHKGVARGGSGGLDEPPFLPVIMTYDGVIMF